MTKQEVLDYLDNVLHPIVSPDNWNVYSELYDMIEELPSAEPMRHGKWIYGNDFHWYTASCNRCGYHRRTDIKADRWNQWNYCPNCGADMRGEKDG